MHLYWRTAQPCPSVVPGVSDQQPEGSKFSSVQSCPVQCCGVLWLFYVYFADARPLTWTWRGDSGSALSMHLGARVPAAQTRWGAGQQNRTEKNLFYSSTRDDFGWFSRTRNVFVLAVDRVAQDKEIENRNHCYYLVLGDCFLGCFFLLFTYTPPSKGWWCAVYRWS